MTTGPAYPIESVDRALRLLTLVAERKAVSVAAAADELGVARSTAHRLLAMLQHHGYVHQDDATKSYSAGMQMLRVGLAAVTNLDVRTVARPHLEALRDEFDETTHLTVLDGMLAVVVDSFESRKALRIGSRSGVTMPLHCTATGKALLAQFSPEYVKRNLPARLEPATVHSIRSRAELLDVLEQVREQGYATNFNEDEQDLTSIAVAIPETAGVGHTAISVSTPTGRMPASKVPIVVAALRRHADEIAAEMSERPLL